MLVVLAEDGSMVLVKCPSRATAEAAVAFGKLLADMLVGRPGTYALAYGGGARSVVRIRHVSPTISKQARH